MNIGIGQQLKDMMRRARSYWAELTDDDHQLHLHEEDEEVHQSYGGVREQGDNAAAQAQPRPKPKQRSGRPTTAVPLQGNGQSQRQYAQQGGSGSQKPLAEQLDNEEGGTAPEAQRGQANQEPRQDSTHH